MPPHRRCRPLPGDLLQGFLDAVLAEIPLAGGRGLADGVDPERLRDGDKGDAGGVPPGPLRRCSDPGADCREVVGDGHRARLFLDRA